MGLAFGGRGAVSPYGTNRCVRRRRNGIGGRRKLRGQHHGMKSRGLKSSSISAICSMVSISYSLAGFQQAPYSRGKSGSMRDSCHRIARKSATISASWA